jgi:hypothetical protein
MNRTRQPIDYRIEMIRLKKLPMIIWKDKTTEILEIKSYKRRKLKNGWYWFKCSILVGLIAISSFLLGMFM